MTANIGANGVSCFLFQKVGERGVFEWGEIWRGVIFLHETTNAHNTAFVVAGKHFNETAQIIHLIFLAN